jgi:uncharacterized protein
MTRTVILIYWSTRGQSTGLFSLAGVKNDAEQLLGVPVSVLTPNGLPPKFRNEVLQQAQPL